VTKRVLGDLGSQLSALTVWKQWWNVDSTRLHHRRCVSPHAIVGEEERGRSRSISSFTSSYAGSITNKDLKIKKETHSEVDNNSKNQKSSLSKP
jgi:hypothetical protein